MKETLGDLRGKFWRGWMCGKKAMGNKTTDGERFLFRPK